MYYADLSFHANTFLEHLNLFLKVRFLRKHCVSKHQAIIKASQIVLTAGFLGLGTTDVRGRMILGWGRGHLVFNSIPGLFC